MEGRKQCRLRDWLYSKDTCQLFYVSGHGKEGQLTPIKPVRWKTMLYLKIHQLETVDYPEQCSYISTISSAAVFFYYSIGETLRGKPALHARWKNVILAFSADAASTLLSKELGT